ncbi:uncharacterized protein LOC110988157 [Acanthaster planci]|uniref:Uncharacterized protein LOC110988157 n=1 Tax=Acanthaster planci TaxID=133434 RepID=A0A8B7ZNW2_ACAPL|nr:uncharacterized protein LOC110988157 [Acanthaster planci]
MAYNKRSRQRSNLHQVKLKEKSCSKKLFGKVFTRRDNYIRHFCTQHREAQIGYRVSVEDEHLPKRQKITGVESVGDVTDLYQVTMVKEVHMRKFNTKGLEYSVTYKE